MMNISKKALDLILAFEVGSQANYEKRLQFPIWPGANSGVTIGIGYDLGYADKTKFESDWKDKLDAATLNQLYIALGLKGLIAKAALRRVSRARVPWKAAISVFETRTIPCYAAATAKAFPGSAALDPHCFGALVSLVYNRGASMTGERRIEMRAIRTAIKAGKPELVPDPIRAMVRLWKRTDIENGMRRRREAEARLFEAGLRVTEAATPRNPTP